MEEGRRLARIHENIVVKVPLIREGIKAVSVLAKEGIRTNVTLCFSAAQALVAAKAGAAMVSPFIGRIEDIGWPGMDLIRDVAAIYRQCGLKTGDSGGLSAGHAARDRSSEIRRAHRYDDAQSAGPTLPASVDRKRSRSVPRRSQ